MEDVREVGAELHRLADAEEMDPFDTAVLLQRGRRGRRRRKILTAGGAVAGVAVVALAATLLPNLGAVGNQPGVAGDQAQNSLFEPVPGATRGEEGANQTMTKVEASRRCALRFPAEKRPLMGGDTIASGEAMRYEVKIGDRSAPVCTVPGGDKPSAALIAAAEKDPVPTSTAGQLRNCSVRMWVDLTRWHVVASDQSKRLATTVLVAISPSGRKAVTCHLEPFPPDSSGAADSRFVTLDSLGPDDPVVGPAKGSQRVDLYAAGSGGGGYCPGTPCGNNYNFTGWGRVASNATKVRVQLGSDSAHEVRVNDGWFAIAWLSPSTGDHAKPTVTAYDKEGKVVKVIDKP